MRLMGLLGHVACTHIFYLFILLLLFFFFFAPGRVVTECENHPKFTCEREITCRLSLQRVLSAVVAFWHSSRHVVCSKQCDIDCINLVYKEQAFYTFMKIIKYHFYIFVTITVNTIEKSLLERYYDDFCYNQRGLLLVVLLHT